MNWYERCQRKAYQKRKGTNKGMHVTKKIMGKVENERKQNMSTEKRTKREVEVVKKINFVNMGKT